MASDTMIKLYSATHFPVRGAHDPALTAAGAGSVVIALDVQRIPFDEEQTDLKVPRTLEYLAINHPRQVPAVSCHGEIHAESAVIAKFDADLKPDGILPAANMPEVGLRRPRVDFIVSGYFDSVNPQWSKDLFAKTDADAETAARRSRI